MNKNIAGGGEKQASEFRSITGHSRLNQTDKGRQDQWLTLAIVYFHPRPSSCYVFQH